MRSMTGIGVGSAREGHMTLRVEIRSVNHRFLDFVFRIPPALADMEIRLRKRLGEVLDRGRVTVTVDLDQGQPDVEIAINESFVAAYIDARRKLASRHGLHESISLSDVLALPEAMTVREKRAASKELTALADKATEQALEKFQTMRQKEGRALAKELRRRLKIIGRETSTLRALAEKVPGDHYRRLEERLAKIGAADAVDPARLAAEVALLADKSSIAEEIERLDSHIQQFDEALAAQGPVAKRMGFLLQEMHREVNTTGSKSSSLDITKAVLRLKEELENMREQIQNLE